jgi:hypothetical protein
MAKGPEKKTQDAILALLRGYTAQGLPVVAFRRQAGALGHDGLPDLYAVVAGRHLEIEVKSKTGTLGPLQRKWGEIIRSAGGEWICADDPAQVKALVERILTQEGAFDVIRKSIGL